MSHTQKKQSTGSFKGAKKNKHENLDKGDKQKKKMDSSWIQLPKRK